MQTHTGNIIHNNNGAMKRSEKYSLFCGLMMTNIITRMNSIAQNSTLSIKIIERNFDFE